MQCARCQLVYETAQTPGGHCPRCLLSCGPATEGGDMPQNWEPPALADIQALLPDYELLGLIGRGGMGAVYKARQRSLDRLVAIKILPPLEDTLGVGYVERFKNEAHLLAKLNHPGIVHVYDFGELPGQLLHFVMEYVDGTDVARLIAAQGRLSPEHAASITANVCAALHSAHQAGVVHRDVKPANILVARDGRIKVADFGLAKKSDPAARGLTSEDLRMGTADYAAPESLTAGMNVDHRADLYAVGVMLYNMLTGEIPRGVFPPASEKSPETSPRFDEIITKAMQKEPERRYQSADLMKSDVEGTGAVVPTPTSVWRQPRRLAWLAAIAAAVVVGLVAWQPWRPAAVSGPSPSGAARSKAPMSAPAAPAVLPNYADNRAAAQWVIAKGGKFTLLTKAGTTRTPGGGILPDEPFEVTGIIFDGVEAGEPMTDAEVAHHLPRLPKLKHFILTQSPRVASGLSEASARVTADLPGLSYVGFDGVRLSDGMVRRLAALPKITALYLSHTPIHGDSLRPAANKLIILSLAFCDIDAAAWKVIGSMRDLELLRVPGLKLDETAIETLIAMKTLRRIGWVMDQTNDPALVRIREGNPKLVVRLLPKWDATEPPPYRAAAP